MLLGPVRLATSWLGMAMDWRRRSTGVCRHAAMAVPFSV
jgi:hypothetical protein